MPKKRKDNAPAALPWTVHLVGILAGLALLTPLLPAGALGGPVLLKGNVWQILTLMMAAVWLTLAAGDRRYRPSLKSPLIAAYLAWLAFLLVSLPFSGNPFLSFWSSRDRVLGVMAIIHWALWLIILGSTFRGWKQWRPFLAGSLAVAVLSTLIGLVEVAANSWYYRIESTQGNAIYLSSYLLPHVFIALILLARASGWPRRLMYGLAGLIVAWGVVQSGTRGALLAMLFGLLLAGLGYALLFAKNRRQARRWSLVLAVMAVLISAGGLSIRLSEKGKAWGLKHLPTPIHRFIYTDFGSDRLSLWAIGLRGWQDRPWLGYGLENYSDALNHYVDVKRDSSLVENWYDRTHNHFLDMLLGTGLVGLLFYLAVWVAAFWTAISGLRQAEHRDDRLTFWLTIPLFAAYAIAIALAFETPSAAMVLLLVMAMTVGLRRSTAASADSSAPNGR
ncbi:MAG: O-antigen ligase family protein, partial [Candidatus Promineifilaceae bacterium]